MRLNATRPVNAGLTGGLPVEEELPRSSSSGSLSCHLALSRRLMSRPAARKMPPWSCSGRRGWSRCGGRARAARPGRGGRGAGMDGRPALPAAGAGKIGPGELVVFCKPVVVARAVVRRDGRVQAAGHPADHVRLGVAEERLDELTGTAGVIDELARSVKLEGKVKGKSRRAMTAALAIRFTLLMTAMPDADYPEVIAALLGDLAAVPWHRRYRLPTATVAPTWRDALGPGPLEKLRDMLLAAIGAEHDDHDYRAVQVGDLDVCSIDGSLTRVPDTPANRQAYGSAGTADDSSPYPQLRELRLSNASTRAALG